MTGLSLLQVGLVQHSHMELNSGTSSESMWNPLAPHLAALEPPVCSQGQPVLATVMSDR